MRKDYHRLSLLTLTLMLRRDNRLKNYDGALGKINRAIAIPPQETGGNENDPIEDHPYLYDIDFVLGGKVTNCHRRELLYTTADAEGMTGDAVRTKRQRKPSSALVEAKAEVTPSAPKKQVGAKKSVAKSISAKKAQKTPGRKVAPPTKTSKKNTSQREGSGAGTKMNKAKAQNGKVAVAPKLTERDDDDYNDDEAIAKDLFEKHRKDFERCFTRLEKADHFGFFFEAPPPNQPNVSALANVDDLPNVDESPNVCSPPDVNDPGTSPTRVSFNNALTFSPIAPRPEQEEYLLKDVPSQDAVADASTDLAPTSPPKPDEPLVKTPLTWYDLREFRDAGRYVVDRLSKLEKARKKRLGPYVWDKRKRRKQLEVEGNKVIETWEIQEFASKGSTKQVGGKRSLTRNGVRVHPRVLHPRGVDWDLFRSDVLAMCDAGIARDPLRGDCSRSGTLGHTVKKVKELLEQIFDRTGKKQMKELELADARHEFTILLKAQINKEAAFQGEWRKIPFPERKYERLKSDVICAGLSRLDEQSASYEKQTELPESFVGLAYTYNDTGESEGWMKSVFKTAMSQDRRREGLTAEEERAATALATDDGVVRAQVRATMRTLLICVQDKVLTDKGVLTENELRSANWDMPDTEKEMAITASEAAMSSADVSTVTDGLIPDLVEQSVWGIDCYTRRNIIICIEKDLDAETAVVFVEKWLLPAINACPAELAYDLANAAKILEGLPLQEKDDINSIPPQPMNVLSNSNVTENWSHSLIGQALLHKIKFNGPSWLKAAAHQLRRAIESLGYDFFRVHPKGHGSIVLSTKVKANTLVTFYRGEVYPSWRWGEKLDAIEMTQEYIGLRPNLPDFYNMALERPQSDPKGYGLMIVDGSRKAGHGSMLSHSCDPTCEVRVAALNGQLCLAMTTLRDIEQGEELTFDYNAVTESLEEYQAAVCLCGCSKCRGSFLHFATADCYQQVLNRNSPVAVRFANLVKGCTKKVMSEEDNQTLTRHGFGTAAFGAVSFNRHLDLISSSDGARLDSMANVPIWLKTYVADVLRYIEYERRALPVALLCDHFKTDKTNENKSLPLESTSNTKISKSNAKTKSKRRQKDEPREKAENSFQHFVRINKDMFLASLGDEKVKVLKGTEIQNAIRTVGSAFWKKLDDKEKMEWKARAIADWEKSRGSRDEEGAGSPENKSALVSDSQDKSEDAEALKDAPTKDGDSLNLSRISFEAADAEGVSAMEQRIQQLTQSLSRIGRILDHHREENGGLDPDPESIKPKAAIHSPLSILTDSEIVDWMWCNEHGVVKCLLQLINDEGCTNPSLYESLVAKTNEYQKLEDFVRNPSASGMSSMEARRTLTTALLELRDCLNDGVQELAKEFKQHELQRARMKAKARRDEVKAAATREVMSVLQDIINQVVRRCEGQLVTDDEHYLTLTSANVSQAMDLTASPWLENYHRRWKLEAAADILLLHARTSTFFKIVPYSPVNSTSIEVYARELGNNIPLSTINRVRDENAEVPSSIVVLGDKVQDGYGLKSSDGTSPSCSVNGKKKRSEPLCDPDAVIANVTVKYSGDYVVSQLLQWFNGGIGQKQGLPEMTGCVLLPSIEATFASSTTHGGKAQKPTHYRSHVRPRLFEWLRDPHQRGSTFPDDLSKVLKGPERVCDEESLNNLAIGSPVLDLLVMGDDSNINAVLAALDHDRLRDMRSKTVQDSATARLESTIDEAMPIQAIAKWVQCENEGCLKWRRLPFFVDLDVLPEQFFCKDNIWNPEAQTCDSPEDVWDDNDNQVHNDGVAKPSDMEMQLREVVGNENPVPGVKYQIGERYDVLRKKKKSYCTGEVVDTDFKGEIKRVKMHFPKIPEKFDEWIELPSIRIAPLFSKQFQKTEATDIGSEETSGNSKNTTESKSSPEDAGNLGTVRDSSSVAATLLALRHNMPCCETVDVDTPPNKKPRVIESPLVGKPPEKRLSVSIKGPLENTDSEDDLSEPKCKKLKKIAWDEKGKKFRVDVKRLDGKNPATDSTQADSLSNADSNKIGRAIHVEDTLSRQKHKNAKKTARHETEGKPLSGRVDKKKFEAKKSSTEAPAIGAKETVWEDELPQQKCKKMKKAAREKSPSFHIDTTTVDIEVTASVAVENNHANAESSFTIPRKRKNDLDSPQALKTSSLINSSPADLFSSRIPRKMVHALSSAGPNEAKGPIDSPAISVSSITSREVTQSRPRSLNHEQPTCERHIASSSQAYRTSTFAHQVSQYSQPLRDNQSYLQTFASPNKTTHFHDAHYQWRRDADPAQPRPTPPEPNSENQYQPNLPRHLTPK